MVIKQHKDCNSCVGYCEDRVEYIITTTTIDLYPVMREMKSKRPKYIDGGLKWTDYAYLGQVMEHEYVKFGRGKELLKLLKDVSRKA